MQRRSLHINPLVALANLDKTGLERHFFSTLLAFEQLKAQDKIAANPLRDAFRTRVNRHRMLMAAALPLLNSVGYYVIFNYLPTYLSK